MSKFRIVEVDGVLYVEEKDIWTLFCWRRWSRWCGSFGNEDIKYESVEAARAAIEKYKRGENRKTYAA